jgi:hypothetical protein
MTKISCGKKAKNIQEICKHLDKQRDIVVHNVLLRGAHEVWRNEVRDKFKEESSYGINIYSSIEIAIVSKWILNMCHLLDDDDRTVTLKMIFGKKGKFRPNLRDTCLQEYFIENNALGDLDVDINSIIKIFDEAVEIFNSSKFRKLRDQLLAHSDKNAISSDIKCELVYSLHDKLVGIVEKLSFISGDTDYVFVGESELERCKKSFCDRLWGNHPVIS